MFPVVWFFLLSIRTEAEMFTVPPKILPSKTTLSHYTNLFTRFGFGLALQNSILIALFTMLVSVGVGALAAYGFSRYRFRGASAMMIAIFFTRMLMPASLIVPLYDLIDALGLLDTVWAITIGHITWTLPLSVWLLKSYFDELPLELEEAAAIDGMSSLQILTKVAMPISLPGLAVAAMFAFWGSWNEFFFAVCFGIRETRTGLVALSWMRTTYVMYWGEIAAGGFLFTIPAFIVGLFLQKYMVRGLTLGAIK